MINIIYDNPPHSNVWYAGKKPESMSFNYRHHKYLPGFIHLNDNITFHSSADGLDSFIYPILMLTPYIQVRSLIHNHSDFGFWSYVSDSVIKGLREKKGWIIIDICLEPITQDDFDCVINSLSDSSLFPNDRIILNTVSPHFTEHKRVVCHPSFLEMGCYFNEFHQDFFGNCYCVQKNIKEIDPYPHKRFLSLNSRVDYPAARLFAKYTGRLPESFLNSSGTIPYRPGWTSVLDSSGTISGETYLLLPNALYATDLNVVFEAYADNKIVDYAFMTEKIWRNIKYKKPFIVVGQQYTLAAFRKLGYKTFHPQIDESYDTHQMSIKRTERVLIELERLRQMSDAKWSEFLESCKPIVEHNYNNLLHRIKQPNVWLDGLKDL